MMMFTPKVWNIAVHSKMTIILLIILYCHRLDWKELVNANIMMSFRILKIALQRSFRLALFTGTKGDYSSVYLNNVKMCFISSSV